MRKFLPLAALLLAPACSAPDQQPSAPPQNSPAMDRAAMSEEPAMMPSITAPDASVRSIAAPGINPTAAPGVAFNYRYGFRLPAQRIVEVQEQHAQACEKLGANRCRITGMLYRYVNEHDIQGMLAFKLDPAIARQFGKQGIEAVDRAEGMLVESQITGEDAGSQIAAATRTDAELNEDLQRIEQQLARTGLRSSERAELQIQAQQLRDSIRANRTNKSERQESLAKTPMVFNYGAGDLAPGFDNDAPFGHALDRAVANFMNALAVMLVITVTLLPWALLVLLGWWIWRRLRVRIRAAGPAAETASGEE